MIFYSTGTCWWTHSVDDLEKATEMGVNMKRLNHKRLMDRTDIPLYEKQKMEELYNMANPNHHQVALDPTGCPLFPTDKPMDFIRTAKKNKGHYGRHGLKAFMFSHHQNSPVVYKSFSEYNDHLDLKNGKI